MTHTDYTGDVAPGGPSDVRELPHLTIRKTAVSSMHNNVYLLTDRATGHQLLVDAADDVGRITALVAEGTGRLDLVGVVVPAGTRSDRSVLGAEDAP